MLKKIGGVVVAIAIGLGWWGFSTWKAKSDAPEVGKCVVLSGSTTDADVEEADCGGDDVLFKVMADDGDCDTTEASYTVEVNGSDAVNLCLDWAVDDGTCVKAGNATEFDKIVECSEKSATPGEILQIVSTEDGADAKCGKQETPLPNEKRDYTFCVIDNA